MYLLYYLMLYFLLLLHLYVFFFFFFNDTATTEIYTLSLHDALPICRCGGGDSDAGRHFEVHRVRKADRQRSEEHTSELQSPCNLVCRLLLEKKKNTESMNPRSLQSISARKAPQRLDTTCRGRCTVQT